METQKKTERVSRLRELREEAVLTVRELSEQSGVSEDAITKIENGHRKARPSTLKKLAKALGVEPQELNPTGRTVELSGTVSGRSSASGQLTVTVSVPLTLRWNTAEALKSGKELSPDELREIEEAARAELADE